MLVRVSLGRKYRDAVRVERQVRENMYTYSMWRNCRGEIRGVREGRKQGRVDMCRRLERSISWVTWWSERVSV